MSSNEFNTALTPVMQSHFDTIIKPKDRNDGVTEGELFAGVAYHAIIEQSGADAGREYLKMVNDERAKGSGLFTAAKVALNKMGKFFAKTKFKSKKGAAKLGEDLEREIRNTARSSSQLDGKAGVSNRKESAKTLTEAYQAGAAAYQERSNGGVEDTIVDKGNPGAADPNNSNGNGSSDGGTQVPADTPNIGSDNTVPSGPDEVDLLMTEISELDTKIDGLIAALTPTEPKAYQEQLNVLQQWQDMRKALRELLTNVVKSRGEGLVAVARNIR